ncbi:MAG: MarR family winged helix-turn-helix transcriptional regulator [Clostridia bacterium]|nr:MarR family winged helix-turn-helix transcriptional regulator [Clostridia bacterium]
MFKVESIDVGITPLLYRAAHKCTMIHNEMVKEFSISVQQAAILAVIEFMGNGEMNQKRLSDEMSVKESSVSSIVKTMIKNNFIYKEQSKTDARNQILKATEKGKEVCEKLKSTAKRVEEELYGHLSETEREELIAILKKLV